MTREDAIYWIKNLAVLSTEKDMPQIEEALNMAIEAFGQTEPFADEPEWISVKERLPKDNVPVNITWINRNPEPYYKSIKDVPFTATGVYFKGKWYWYSSTVEDYLAEYGRAEWDEIEETMAGCIEVTAWMPLPEAYEE